MKKGKILTAFAITALFAIMIVPLSNANSAPVVGNELPEDGATNVSTSPELSVGVYDADNDTVTVNFYSYPDDSFIGADTVTVNYDRASVTWAGLNYSTMYGWYVILNDGTTTTTSDVFGFTTTSGTSNHAAVISDNYPGDGSTGISLSPTLHVKITDADNDMVTVTFKKGDGTTIGTQTATDTSSGTYVYQTWSGLTYNTTYHWYVIANDGTDTTTSITYSFTTRLAAPVASFNYSVNGDTVTVNASASYDPDGTIVLYEWDWNSNGTYDETYTTPVASHKYESPGTYTITLRVTDNDGLTDTATNSGGGFIIPSHSPWKLPFSWFEMLVMIFIGVFGMALSSFYLKPESIKAIGYAPAAGTMLITVLIIGAMIMYHAGIAWYWIAGVILLIFFILYVTIKAVAIKKKKLVKSVFKHKKVRRRR